MMELWALLIALVMAVNAQAHLEIGTYQGVVADQTNCALEIKKIEFEGGVHHPLNERVEVAYRGETHILKHLPVVNDQDASVKPDSARLISVYPNNVGAQALVLKIDHSPGAEGPTSIEMLSHEYQSGKKSKSDLCSGLKLQK